MAKTLKWCGLVVCTICMILTSLNMYPQNLILGVIGNGLWTASGIVTNDEPLFISSLISTAIFFFGFAYYIY